MRPRAKSSLAALACVFLVSTANASESIGEGKDELDVRADDVSVDMRLLELELRGNVHADAPPFHLSSDHLKLKRTAKGIVIDGTGSLAFCPCLGTPLTIAFSGATVAPPGDLFLRNPRLLIFGLPVFWLPIFWLRSPGRVGLLPPDISYRGTDGFFLGGGVHVPWSRGDAEHGVDIRGGGYFKGGFATAIDLTTPSSFTRVVYDRGPTAIDGSFVRGIPGGYDGLTIDARGSLAKSSNVHEEVAWDADLIRGARGMYTTTEVEAVARPFDRVALESRVRNEGWLAAVGLYGSSPRGGVLGNFETLGPMATLSASQSIGEIGSMQALATGGMLRDASGFSMAFLRGTTSAMVSARAFGVLGTASAALAGDVISDGDLRAIDGVAHARLELSLPLGRSFVSRDPGDPWRHRLEPLLSVSALAAAQDRPAAMTDGIPTTLQGRAVTTGAGFRTALAKWARGDGFELEGTVGSIFGDAERVLGVARWRAVAQSRLFALSAEGAHVLGRSNVDGGDAWVARARVGESSGLFLRTWVATRLGLDPASARLLTNEATESTIGFLNDAGWTGGARARIPWAKYFATSGGVDVDFSSQAIVAAVAGIELRDTCGCFRLRAAGAHRMGRDGVDVWVTLDLTPEMARR